jgi:transposase InsO family protein
MTDITEPSMREGKVYCAVVLDACSRRVVGWSIDASPTATLVTNALGMAIDARRPTGSTVIHSDQGTQHGSWAFTRRALDVGLLPSMGAVGTCCDHALLESFWSRVQVELLDRQVWSTRPGGNCATSLPVLASKHHSSRHADGRCVPTCDLGRRPSPLAARYAADRDQQERHFIAAVNP